MIGINGVINLSTDPTIRHIPKFGGELWFVDDTIASSGDGKSPDAAFKTIGEAITACAAGDAINIKAGTYTENSLDVNKNAVELWGEIGASIEPTGASTCLVVSGNDCKILGLKVSKAVQVGFQITGTGCRLEDCISDTNSIAYDIDGAKTTLIRCRDIEATTTGYDIATADNLLHLCSTLATGGTSRGFYLSNTAADDNMLYQCVSTGNIQAGYEIVSGASQNVLAYCSSGGLDGRWVDNGASNSWPAFTFEDEIKKEIEVDSAQTINIFEVTGTVKIHGLHGYVTEIITSAGAPTMHLSLFSATAEVDLTLDAGPNIIDDVIGTVYIRNADSTNAIVKGENDNTPFIIENGSYRDPEVSIIVGADDDSTTYIRYNNNAVCTDGKIEWHCTWEPVTDAGFLKPV